MTQKFCLFPQVAQFSSRTSRNAEKQGAAQQVLMAFDLCSVQSPVLALMLWCCRFEILDNFLRRQPYFSSSPEPHKLCNWSSFWQKCQWCPTGAGAGLGESDKYGGRGSEKPHGHSTSGDAECPVDRQDSPEGVPLGSKAEAVMAIWAGGVFGHQYQKSRMREATESSCLQPVRTAWWEGTELTWNRTLLPT